MSLFVLLAAVGCGEGQKSDATASINGPGDEEGGSGDPGNQPAPSPEETKTPVVLIKTSLGEITVELDREKALLTVNNFLNYVQKEHFDGTIFHEVIPGSPALVIGGAYAEDLTEKPTDPPVMSEAHNGLHNTEGTIAMARQADDVHSATCHFFFNLADNREVLDHRDRTTVEGYGYCVFGKITSGLDVAKKIGQVETESRGDFDQIPKQAVVIESIRRVH